MYNRQPITDGRTHTYTHIETVILLNAGLVPRSLSYIPVGTCQRPNAAQTGETKCAW